MSEKETQVLTILPAPLNRRFHGIEVEDEAALRPTKTAIAGFLRRAFSHFPAANISMSCAEISSNHSSSTRLTFFSKSVGLKGLSMISFAPSSIIDARSSGSK